MLDCTKRVSSKAAVEAPTAVAGPGTHGARPGAFQGDIFFRVINLIRAGEKAEVLTVIFVNQFVRNLSVMTDK